MRFPNKITSYNESILSKFYPILSALSRQDMPVYSLYYKIKQYFPSVCDYIDALDCLFAMGKIALDEEKGILRYVM